MPADASIYSMIRPQAQAPGPLDQYAQTMTLRNLMGQQDLQGMQIAAGRRDMETQDKLRDLFARNPNPDATAIGAIDPKYAQTYKTNQLANRKTETEVQEKELNMALKRIEHGASVLSTAKDQPSYDMALKVMADSLGPNAIEKMPRQFDPAYVKSSIEGALTWAQKLTDQRARDTQAETGRHNLATENTSAGQLAVSRGNLGVAQGNLGVSRDRLAFDKATPARTYDADRGVVVNTRDGTAAPVTVGGEPLPAKLPESSKKELASIDAQANTIRAAIEGVKKTPSAFGFKRGVATMAGAIPETLAGRMDSTEEREARSFVFNVVSKVINERAGAAQSAQELARLRSFLPAEADDAKQIEDKLNGFEKYLGEQRKAYAVAPGASPPPAPTPPAAPPAPAAQNVPPKPKLGEKRDGYTYRGGDPADPKSWAR